MVYKSFNEMNMVKVFVNNVDAYSEALSVLLNDAEGIKVINAAATPSAQVAMLSLWISMLVSIILFR